MKSSLRAVLAPLAFLAFAAPALAAEIPLSDLSAYLNRLTTAQSDFTQVNADGSISTGRLFISRPGKVRFEYAPPDDTLVMAGSGQVAIFDGKSTELPEQYPLSKTPLGLILAADVDLGRENMVTGHREEENTTRVTAQDPAHPEYGSIELVFTAGPTELRQWVITDDAGGQTTVILGEMAKGGAMKPALFNIRQETERRGN